MRKIPKSGGKLSARHILKLAHHAQTLDPDKKRIVVMSLFEEAIGNRFINSQDIFRASYGDEFGDAYWSGWLVEDQSSLYQFVHFLEVHLGTRWDIIYIRRSRILEAIAVASLNSPRWLKKEENGRVGATSDVLKASNDPQHLSHWLINGAEATEWLFKHPDYNSILPKLVQEFYKRSIIVKANQCSPTAFTISTRIVKNENLKSEKRKAGRPTVMPDVENELRKRSKSGQTWTTVRKCCTDMSEWVNKAIVPYKPKAKNLSAKSISNKCAPLIHTLELIAAPENTRLK